MRHDVGAAWKQGLNAQAMPKQGAHAISPGRNRHDAGRRDKRNVCMFQVKNDRYRFGCLENNSAGRASERAM